MVKTYELHVTKREKQSHLVSTIPGLAASLLILISQITHRSVFFTIL